MLRTTDTSATLALCKSAALQAGQRLLDHGCAADRNYVYSDELPKEIKSFADNILEQEILRVLLPTGITILSEESGYLSTQSASKQLLIVDPLDGTFNFVKGLGPSAVSIALWENNHPIFGVIYNLSNRQLTWGGPSLGSYCDGRRIAVSATTNPAEGSICTGFPVRFDTSNTWEMKKFADMVKPFAKVRMFGSAAISLLHVANGSADVYSEKNIMLWDVAAGLAIVLGAGGSIAYLPGDIDEALNVYAHNGTIQKSVQANV